MAGREGQGRAAVPWRKSKEETVTGISTDRVERRNRARRKTNLGGRKGCGTEAGIVHATLKTPKEKKKIGRVGYKQKKKR